MGKGTQKRERSTETLFVGNSSNQSGQRKSNKKKNVNALYIEFENCKYSRKGNRNKTTNLLFLQHLLLTVKKENLTIKCT